MKTEPDEDFSPERIHWYLEHWEQLQVAAEGGTGSLAGNGAGRGDRLALVVLLADLERAADQLPLDWYGTREVFKLQRRGRIWADRRLHLNEDLGTETAINRMATILGWRP